MYGVRLLMPGVRQAALVIVQVSIAIAFKASQTSGHKYTFSQASSLAFTESIKFLISFGLFYRESDRAGLLNGAGQSERPILLSDSNGGHLSESIPLHQKVVGEEEEEEEEEGEEEDAELHAMLGEGRATPFAKAKKTLHLWKQNLTPQFVASFALLAIFYAINNHAAFFVFRLADPGTITLVKVRPIHYVYLQKG